MQKDSSKGIAGKDRAITGLGVGEATRKDLFPQEVKTPPLVGGSRFRLVLLSQGDARDRHRHRGFGRAAVTAEGSSWILTETGIERARGPSTALFPAHDRHVPRAQRLDRRMGNASPATHASHMLRGPLHRPMIWSTTNALLTVQ